MNRYWIDVDTPLPAPGADVPGYPGLVALGADLSAARLIEAYTQGMFPWYSDGQPVLWWSPDPRMVLFVDEFRPSRSLRRLLKQLHQQASSPGHEAAGPEAANRPAGVAPGWRLSLDRAFEAVMRQCASPRDEEGGTWITEDIIRSYGELHCQGLAHSVEVWEGGSLIGGLYGVAIGRMFFGESMFTRRPNASKCALAALVQLLRQQGFRLVDCQQATRHLRSLGGRTLPRQSFLSLLPSLLAQPAPDWSALQLHWPSGWPASGAPADTAGA